MFQQKLNDAMVTVEPATRAAVVAVLLKTAKDLGRQISAHNAPALANRLQIRLEEQLADMAMRLAPELAGTKKSARREKHPA